MPRSESVYTQNSSQSERASGKITILWHDWKIPHWDLLMEFPPNAEKLPTWAIYPEPDNLSKTLFELPKLTYTALRLPDHRRFYLDYEGPVSDFRGSVTKYATGTYIYLTSTNQNQWGIFSIDLQMADQTFRHGILAITRPENDDKSDCEKDISEKYKRDSGYEPGWHFVWSLS